MELPSVGFLLAAIAGLLNAWSFANATTFATVQSGNVVQSGYFLMYGNWMKFTVAFSAVLCFALGSALCGVLMTTLKRGGRSYSGPVLVLLAVVLAVLLVLVLTDAVDPRPIALAISFVAGAQGNAFHKNHGMLFGAVAVTMMVQMAANFLAQSAFSTKGLNDEANLAWSGIFTLVLVGFAGGAAVGALVDKGVNGASIAVAALVLLGLGIVAFRTQRPDPTPAGSFA